MTILLVIISLSILILVHELGHFLSAKMFGIKVEEFGLGFPPKIISKKIGETEYSLNALPFGGFVKIYGENGEDLHAKDERSFSHKPAWKRAVVMLAGVTMNIILAWLVISFIFVSGIPQHLLISEVAQNSPASASGLKPGDIVLQGNIGGKTLTDPIEINSFINLIKSNPNENINLTIERGGKTIELTSPIRPNPPAGEGPLGIALVETGLPPEPIPLNFVKGAESSIISLKLITLSFYKLFIGIFTTPEIIKNVAGPIGIFSIATQAGKMGITYLAQLMALISLNLAVLNLIPFPALDGGRFLLLIVEKIKGKPISFRTQAIANSLGFAALIVLMVLVTIKDISNLLG